MLATRRRGLKFCFGLQFSFAGVACKKKKKRTEILFCPVLPFRVFLKFIDNGGWEGVGLTLQLTFARCSVFLYATRSQKHRTQNISRK
jgi:hypothetical protein